MKPWAILPVKEMAGAKQRLAPLLSPEERMALMQVMLRDVLTALSAARDLAGVALVTLDSWAQALAREYRRAESGLPRHPLPVALTQPLSPPRYVLLVRLP